MGLGSYTSPQLTPDSLSGRRTFDLKWLIIGFTILIVTYLGIVPLIFLIWQSFSTPQTLTQAATFTLQNYEKAYTDPRTVELFKNSFTFAFGTCIVAFVIGTALAWMNERTNTPFKSLFYALSIIPLIIPGILFTVS